jgi:photoactive yellow protein
MRLSVARAEPVENRGSLRNIGRGPSILTVVNSRILVVEDDPDLARLFSMILAPDGYTVDITPSGVHGLVRLHQTPYAAVLLDIQVEDLNGLAVQRAVRDFSSVPVIVMSALGGTEWQKEAFEAGASACLPKPFALDTLLGLIDHLVREPQTPPKFPADVRRLSAEDLARLGALSEAELNALPFGVLRLDAEGRIDVFNQFEADAVKIPPGNVLGRKFSEVVPCVTVREFVSQVEPPLAAPVDAFFRFEFPHGNALQVVTVRLYREGAGRPTWILVSRRRPS